MGGDVIEHASFGEGGEGVIVRRAEVHTEGDGGAFHAFDTNVKAAHSLTRRICEVSEGRAGVGLAAQLSGGIFYSAALAAEMIWDPGAAYEEITERLSARRYITKT